MLEGDGPLLSLARRLRSRGPPSLSMLIAKLSERDDYLEFVRIVRELLPEWEQEILGCPTPEEQVAIFASRFEGRYFPLSDWVADMFEDFSDLVCQIPVVLMGLDWDDYHSIPENYGAGLQLMTYLLEEVDEEVAEEISVSLAEACARHVPQTLLKRRPDGGLPVAVAHQLLDGTDYAGLALWGDALMHDTHTLFIDVTGEEMGYDWFDWDRETVEELTRQWRRAEYINQTTTDLARRIEENPAAQFREMLDFIERRRDEI